MQHKTYLIKVRAMKYPIGIQTFDKIRNEGYVYIDKTDMIYSLVTEGQIYFLSRPRRFGKSLLISTLESYFLGREDLFHGLAIEKLEKDWKKYPVIHIDFGAGNFTKETFLDETLNAILSAWEKKYQIKNTLTDFGLRFVNLLNEIHRQTGLRAVVLIDEYDKPLLDVMDLDYKVAFQGTEITLEEYNRNTLKGFYSAFKAADADLQFVFLTGVTKFSQVSVFSGFNQPEDISMSPAFDTLCGITEEELIKYFSEPIKKMSGVYHCSFEDLVRMLMKQYNGYHFSDTMNGVINPFSLLNACKNLRLQDYWFKTGTPTYLARLLSHYDENMDELTGKYYSPDHFIDYKADTERPLPMIYQSGYLTIKDYKHRTNTFLLDFPNDEVKRGFISLLANNYFQTKEDVKNWLTEAVENLDEGNLDHFKFLITSFLSSIPYTMRRKENEREKERYFHYTFYLLLRLASTYITYTEKEQSQGRVDCIIETDKYIYIFEFKLDGTAKEALQQIEEKGYAQPYLTDSRKLYKIGCSFSSETGTIEDWDVKE